MGLTGHDLATLLGRTGAGLLLDLDGTLVDSEPVHREAFRTYFAGRGWTVAGEVLLKFSGRRAAEVFPTVRGPWTGEDPDALTAGVLKALRRATLRPEPVAGAARLIAACARVRLPVAVVTSAQRGWVTYALGVLGVANLDLPMVTASDCARGKPDAEPYQRGAELLGLRPRDVVVAEDAPAGVVSARAAGIGHVIGVTTTSPAAALIAAGSDETAPDLVALATAVETLTSTH